MALTKSDTVALRPPTSMRLVGQGKGAKVQVVMAGMQGML